MGRRESKGESEVRGEMMGDLNLSVQLKEIDEVLFLGQDLQGET